MVSMKKKMNPQMREEYRLCELLRSLDESDQKTDELLAVEAEKRLKEYRARRVEDIPIEEVFQK